MIIPQLLVWSILGVSIWSAFVEYITNITYSKLGGIFRPSGENDVIPYVGYPRQDFI